MVDFFGIFRNGVRDGSGVLRLPATGGVANEIYQYTNNVNGIQRSPSSPEIGSLLHSPQITDPTVRARHTGAFARDPNDKVVRNNTITTNYNNNNNAVKKGTRSKIV